MIFCSCLFSLCTPSTKVVITVRVRDISKQHYMHNFPSVPPPSLPSSTTLLCIRIGVLWQCMCSSNNIQDSDAGFFLPLDRLPLPGIFGATPPPLRTLVSTPYNMGATVGSKYTPPLLNPSPAMTLTFLGLTCALSSGYKGDNYKYATTATT